ncbi:DUF2975 domain-containing protein [Avrilella dinanensis]|uniref:DUF2975 domain-containing protein n=1 Tax=Avrilella dinanensis TaxID=2008672 RepID=A0A2M9R5K3_9FLAO|nr:DUF2975 domain-containing protein [Avrilella dinanensis]PJR04137.1 hypothetical protein CDL10_06085 [Avrilella dinanensis]
MRKIFILRAILQFMLFFLVMGGVVLLVMIPLILFNSDWNIPVTISGNDIEEYTIGTKIIMAIGSIAYLLYVYAIYLLKKTIDLFIEKFLFDDKVIRNFNTIGKVFIIVALLTSVSSFFYHVYTNQEFVLDLTGYDSDSMLFNIAIGLFFITLSEVFKIAKIQKEENELTI